MTVIRHELKQSRISLIIWTAAIGFLLAVCIFMFPEMKGEMNEVNEVFSSMGSFTQAFGMDKVNFGTLLGFYAVECGNILGLGGAFFASLCAISVLSKEEKERTAEFLLTHPVSRVSVVAEKLISVILQIVILNVVVYVITASSIALIGEEVPWQEITLMHTAYLILQLELAGICFGVSAFLRRGSIGTGLGIAVIMYFLNIIANLTESAEFLKYITPFGYADGAEIVRNVSLDMNMIAIGLAFAVVGILAGFIKYCRKDIS
ncbi:ABC transporter permease subunit [Ruminococcus sp.]|jgi:ABC-2 type transport system permease protein|uniref:ABC transporter permease subunit n=1 Tax=Ruminococcus sp. TaxID=41978 RepID=UPI0025FB3FCE|nr:ABC transporter permease subunit [Ruminococcus sp.]MCI2112279.1 ABC transporter permease [Ruminococcus sp.]MDD6987959.1 ABC transporter permease subunit [Ruminococcus sp.]MDY6201559.1 ABC transporter permease subunit [Ruminococcus sp.]